MVVGGCYEPSLLGGRLGVQPFGISNSHNNYETDFSITYFDAYMNSGNAVFIDISSFKRLLSNQNGQILYPFDSFLTQAIEGCRSSIANNPYFFSTTVANFVVAPAAHYIPVRVMSNYTSENPHGYLDQDILKTFWYH